MKLLKMEAKRVDDDVVVVQEYMENETGCYVSKASDDSIEGRYLHRLAGAVADGLPAYVKLAQAVDAYTIALDQWENTDKAERRVKTAEADIRKALAAVKSQQQ